jgi:hypothetical protein
MAAHPVNHPLRHSNPLRYPLEYRRNAPRIKWPANLLPSDHSPKYRPLRNLRLFQPHFQPFHGCHSRSAPSGPSSSGLGAIGRESNSREHVKVLMQELVLNRAELHHPPRLAGRAKLPIGGHPPRCASSVAGGADGSLDCPDEFGLGHRAAHLSGGHSSAGFPGARRRAISPPRLAHSCRRFSAVGRLDQLRHVGGNVQTLRKRLAPDLDRIDHGRPVVGPVVLRAARRSSLKGEDLIR